MTDSAPRIIGGLAPRTADLSRLQRRNRPEATSQQEPTRDRDAPAPTPAPAFVETAVPDAASPAGTTDRVTVYLDHTLRLRARTAYRATAHLEGDRTWSQFIERAVLREIERREHEHNNGDAYPGSDAPLAPGRSVN